MLENGAIATENDLKVACTGNQVLGTAHSNIIKLLINTGLTIENQNLAKEAIKQRDDFFEAIEKNDIEKIKSLLDQGAAIFIDAKKDDILILDTLIVSDEIMRLLKPDLPVKMPTKSARKIFN